MPWPKRKKSEEKGEIETQLKRATWVSTHMNIRADAALKAASAAADAETCTLRDEWPLTGQRVTGQAQWGGTTPERLLFCESIKTLVRQLAAEREAVPFLTMSPM